MHSQGDASFLEDSAPTPPPVKSWRPFRQDDLTALQKLDRRASKQLFGDYVLEEAILMSTHRIVMENVNGEIMACMCLRSYPNVPSLLPELWKQWLDHHYVVPDMAFENTMFVHLMLWDRRYDWEWMTHIIETLFLNQFRLHFIVLVVMPGCEDATMFSYRLLGKYFYEVRPKQRSTTSRTTSQTLYITRRDKVLPKLKIRRAVAEDNDDLVDMLDKCAPKLRACYGDFYISEMVLQTSTRDIIVCEYDNDPIGMMSFNSNVRMDYITANYDLATYSGLRRIYKKDGAPLSQESVVSLDNHLTKEDMLSSNIIGEQNKSFSANTSLESTKSTIDSVTTMSIDTASDCLELAIWMSQNDRLSDYESVDEQSSDAAMCQATSNHNNRQRNQQKNGLSDRESGMLVKDKGRPDCFIIEMHTMRADYDDRLVLPLLQASFETYPDLTYCLISVPSVEPSTTLLSYFVKAIQRHKLIEENCSMLYVLHRNALFSKIGVRFVHPIDDEEPIRQFLKTIPLGSIYANDVLDAARRPDMDGFNAFAIEAEKQVIGVCVLEYENNMNDLKHSFDLWAYMNIKYNCIHNQACLILKMMILLPAFTTRLPFILAEIYRQTGCATILYKLDSYAKTPAINTMLSEMIPIRPRKRLVYDLPLLRPDQRPAHHIVDNLHDGRKFALYTKTVSTSVKRKTHINSRIIVVGCSNTALAFLEYLVFSERSRGILFTNLTLISPNGFTDCEFDEISELAKGFRFEEMYETDYVRRLAFRTWVNSVHGNVTKIERGEKYVIVDNRKRLYYDRLYLFCGLQFDFPVKIQTPPKEPKNTIFPNNILNVELMLLKAGYLKRMSNEAGSLEKEYTIVVYGDNHYCYSCLQTLLQIGVEPSRLTFVRPRPKPSAVSTTTIFNDSYVDIIMEEILMRSNITVLDNFDITDWKIENNGNVSKLIVESDQFVKELPCSLFVCCERRIVARRTIVVLNNAGLVFDGRLVINKNFQTNDPSIYAAGPMTKYKRVLYADQWRHEFVSRQEIGERLAQMTMNELCTGRPDNRPETKFWLTDNVHIYRQCRITFRPLLAGYVYVLIAKPGRQMPYELVRHLENYGLDLITGMDESAVVEGRDIHYCRIHLNQYNNVETICCLTKTAINVRKYVALWGQHESVLSNLKFQFESNMIHDLHEYFSEPWTYLVAHDYYWRYLRLKNHGMALAHLEANGKVRDELNNCFEKNKWMKLDEKQRAHLVETYMTTELDIAATKSLMDFITEHIDELPMFFNPDLIKTEF